jgi:PAS domain S-box-containing protein
MAWKGNLDSVTGMPPSLSVSAESSGGKVFRALALVAGIYAALGGAVTLAGWFFEFHRLTDWAGRGISMFPNAAVCAMAGGAALLLSVRWRGVEACHHVARALAIFCTALGGLTLLQHFSGWNLGIDELLFARSWGQKASASPMRMGVPASTSFFLIGLCLIFLTGKDPARRVASGVAFFPVMIASLSITGYWFGANELFGVARITGISLQTATIVAALGVGLIAAVPEHGLASLLRRKDAGGEVARKLLLPIIAIPPLLGWLRLLGQQAGLYDLAFGTAIRTLVETGLFLLLLWWTAKGISQHAAAAETAERALRTSEDRFARFMQSLPGLAWIKALDGRYVFVNDAAEKAFGRSRKEIYGLADPEIFSQPTARQFTENDRIAMASVTGLQFIETLEQDGELHFSLVSKFPVLGPDGKPVLVGGMAIDITDRIRAEEALREADRRKDEFLATLAHELRNPLAPIRMAVHFVRMRGTSDPELTKALEVIDRQVQQMVRLLEDLLDVSRISHGKLELRAERVNLASVIQSALETSRPLLGNHDVETDLPAEPVWLQADPVRLAQIFSNLLNNAAKFTRERGRIRLAVERTAKEVAISVQDNGRGIPEEMLPVIFDIFAQGERAGHSQGGGLGIGLSLVKGLVELHGGTVSVRSDGPDAGSEFVVRLPLGEAEQEEVAKSASPPVNVTKRRLLVADDLKDSADSMTALLRALGHEVVTTYGGEEALAAAERHRPEILLLDIGMPLMNGHEVCRRIRSEAWGREMLVIAVTGWGQESDRQLTREAGFDHHLVKPVDPSLLLTLLGTKS